MHNYFHHGVCLVITVISWHLLLTPVVEGVSYSTVNAGKKDPLAHGQKAAISLPTVPEFPKVVSRPGKLPNNYNSNLNQQNQHRPQQQSHSSQNNTQSQPQLHQYQQQPNSIPSTSKLTQNQNQNKPQIHLPSPPATPALPPQPSYPKEPEKDNQNEVSKDKLLSSYHQLPTMDYASYLENILELGKNKGPQQSQMTKNETFVYNKEPSVPPEKFQDLPQDFNLPYQMLTILNALGTGGSLAQASKPEKDGTGNGFTTANAIGYATGDNATVSATVSNKMEVNTQSVILTESASASASSTSNGTAFSQATLAGGGNGMGGGWPSGSGWSS